MNRAVMERVTANRRPMDRPVLIDLHHLEDSSPNKLRTTNPALFKEIEVRIAVERKATVLAAFAGSSKELRDHLDKLDFAQIGRAHV